MKIILTIIFWLSFIFVYSQTANNKQINKYFLSQAYTAQTGNIESFVYANKQWVGINGSPQTQFLNISTGIADNAGIGFNIKTYQTGNFRNLTGNFNFAHRVKLSKKSNILFGINASLKNDQLEISKIKSTGIDPVFSNINTLKSNTVNFGAGISYNYKNFYTGISSYSLTAFSKPYINTSEKFTNSRKYVFHAFYEYETENYFTFEPLIIFDFKQYSISETYNWEVSFLAKYDKQIFAGISFSKNSLFGLTFGGTLTKHIVAAYSYSFAFSGINSNSQGGHEIIIGFLIKRKKVKCKGDLFPVSKQEEFKEKSEEEINNVKESIESLKIKFNKIISKYEERIRRLENNSNRLNNSDLEQGGKLVLPNIRFAVNSSKMFSSSEPELNKIVVKMSRNQLLKIKIIAHAGNLNSDNFIYELSKERAKTIMNYLVKNGIDRNRIIIQPAKKSTKDAVEIQYFK